MEVRLQMALEDAVESGDLAAASTALDRGADPNGTCHALDDVPIASVALSNRDRAMIRLLHDRGATFTWVDDHGRTPLHRTAAARDDSDALAVLLDLGGDPTARDDRGWTPLHYAAAYGYLHNAERLLHHGADRASLTSDGLSPAELARRNSHHTLIELLSRDGHTRDRTDDETPCQTTQASPTQPCS